MQVPDFQGLFEALPSAHMVLDRQLRYVAANKAYERATMRCREELIGQHIFDLFPNEGEGGRRLAASFNRVLETGKPDTLAYVPYDIPRPQTHGGGYETRYWTASHAPVLDASGTVAFIIQNTVDVTDLVRLREAVSLPFPVRSGASELIEHAREVEEAHRELLAESDDFRRLFQQAPGFIAVLSGPNHVFTFANDAYLRLIGRRDVIGMEVRAALPEIEGQGFLEMLDEVYSRGVDRGASGASVMLRQEAGMPLEQFYLDFSYAPIRDREGKVTGVFVQGMDRTEATLAGKRQALLLAELNHRVKNTLATVQSIAAQTLRTARDVPERQTRFRGPHHGVVAGAQPSFRSPVVGCRHAHAGRKRIVGLQPGALRGRRPRHQAQPQGCDRRRDGAARIGHERGQIRRAQRRDGQGARCLARQDGDLQLDWGEDGGPAVAAPIHQGFGSRMITRVVGGELGGVFDCRYPQAGFQCRLTIPAKSYEKTESDDDRA
jgi:PAS domain S-box-containing protein